MPGLIQLAQVGAAAEFDDQCPVSKEQKSQESSTHRHDFTQKSKIKKKRNQHLNQQIEVNGENFEFERDQIEKKAPLHGTLNKLEPTINIGDSKTKTIVSFENNPLYDKKHFISSYRISSPAFDDFKATGNIGLSPAEKKVLTDEFQKEQAKAEREQENASSFYSKLPNDAKISHSQLREVEMLQEQLKRDSNFQLTEKEKSLIQRAERYQQHKEEFYKNNPHIFDDEL